MAMDTGSAGHAEPDARFPASYRNVVAVLRLSRVAPAQKTRRADRACMYSRG
jgi:hypothetical protein